ncbi:MAG: glycerophosphoryl diester phosphodiesterase membrane domain-containing protein [Candidatus Acidiferrales bacterium]|jgi:glycerophosphoryl diester phosphodiesterase family protein
MADLDLRPLSLGEILDRTFSLYRANFLLFIGIAAVPQAVMLLYNLGQAILVTVPAMHTTAHSAPRLPGVGMAAGLVGGALVAFIIYFAAFIYAHGAAVYAVSDIYLGQPATILGSFRKMRGNAGNLLGVMFLSGLAGIAGFFVFIVGALYVACRLFVCVPAAILEDKGPSDSLSRSWELTKDNAGRAFAIFILYLAITYALVGLFSGPFLFMIVIAGAQKNLAMIQFWTVMSQLGTFLGGTLATPISIIASTVFYYDLRVRKEAFDLQMMMASVPAMNAAPPTPGLASPLS